MSTRSLLELRRRQNHVQSERQKEPGQENLDPTQVSLFRVKFLRSFGNHIAIPHTSQDSTARVVETWTRMGQSYQWRQWKGHQRLGTGNGTDRYGRGKQVGRWYSTWGHNGTSCILRRSIGSNSSSSIHQDNQEPRNHNSFSHGKNKSGTLTSNNNSQTRTASSTLRGKIEENN